MVAKGMDLKTKLFKTSKSVRCVIHMQGVIKDNDSCGWERVIQVLNLKEMRGSDYQGDK